MEEDTEENEYQVSTRKMRYLCMCREQLRKRWQDEYLKALQVRHQKSEDSRQTLPNIGNIVLVVVERGKVKVEYRKDHRRY